MTNPDYKELEALIKNALRLSVWAAGEGLAPLDDNGALADSPEEFLFRYSCATGDEDWETLPERLTATIRALQENADGG